jgi:hypothetical protein
MLMRSRTFSIALLLIVVLGPLPASAQVQFTPLDFPGARNTSAEGINDSGVIVGTYYDEVVTRGFVYQGGAFTQLMLPVPNFQYATAQGINNFGEIIGDHGIHPFLLRRDNTVLNLDTFSGHSGFEPLGVNDAGWIVGAEILGTESPAFQLSPTGVYTVFGVTPDRDFEHIFTDINNLNEVSGYRIDIAEPDIAFVSHVGGPGEVINAHDAIGGYVTRAGGLNDAGDVVGWVESEGDVRTGYLRLAGGYTSYFTYPGAYQTVATDINNVGQIVGYYRLAPSDDRHGFLAVVVPEPSSFVYALGVFGGILVAMRHRRKQSGMGRNGDQ